MSIYQQLFKNKIAYYSMLFLLFMGFVAIYAPLIANNKPFIIRTKNKIIYTDYLDSSISTLKLIQKNLNNKQQKISKNLKWVKTSINEVSKLISNKDLSKKLKSCQIHRTYEDNTKLSELILLLEKCYDEPLKYRTFFPIFKSLTNNDIFFMLILPFFALVFLFRKKIKVLKKLTKYEYILAAIFMSLLFTIALSIFKTQRFDPYPYKKIASEFQKGEWALFPIVPFGENENIITESKQAPTLFIAKKNYAKNQNFHLLGTDMNGRDVLARMIYGARISMSIGFVAVSIYVLIGIFLGSIAGYYGGKSDMIISRLMEIVICFPVFFLILTVMAFLRPSIFNIMIIIGLTGWPSIARLMRGEFFRLRSREFVLAAKAMGGSDLRIIFKHIIPNGITPIIISATFGIAGAILTESSLSFIGFGVPQPTASWGEILNNGRNDIYGSWWLTVFPGIAIFLTVTAFNMIGETLRDILDPRLRGVLSHKRK